MGRVIFSVQVLGLSCLLAGCGGGALYDSQAWLPPADTEKATSDWDVADGICGNVADGTKLTEEEKALIQADKELMQSIGNLYESVGTQHAAGLAQAYGTDEPTVRLAAQGVGAVFSAIGAFGATTAEEDKKKKTFRKCMEKLDWKMKDSEENEEQ